jgi:hemerythrin superfamily protein
MTQDHSNRSLAIGATAGLLVGLGANFVRKAVVQAPTMVAGDWQKALAAEHKATLAVFDAMQGTDANQTTRRSMLLAQLKHALAKHAFEEENSIYAALREHGEAESADHLNHDHGYVKQYLYDLTMMSKNSAAWLPKLVSFRAMIAQHMREEEEEIFPRLHDRLSDDENRALTLAMNKEGLKVA